jgi:hypothetical protein
MCYCERRVNVIWAANPRSRCVVLEYFSGS